MPSIQNSMVPRAHRGPRALAIALFTAAALLVTLVAPASAKIFEKGRYEGPYTFVDNGSCPFDLLVEGTVSGQFLMREGKGKVDSAFFLHDRFAFRETITADNGTGNWISAVGRINFVENKAVPLGGNLFAFHATEAAQIAFYDSDDDLIFRDRGTIKYVIVFDTQGDDVPGGIFVEELSLRLNGPHPSWDTWCELFE